MGEYVRGQQQSQNKTPRAAEEVEQSIGDEFLRKLSLKSYRLTIIARSRQVQRIHQSRRFLQLTFCLRFGECWFDRDDSIEANPLLTFRITVISKEDVIPDGPAVMQIHQRSQWSSSACFFPSRE